MPEEPTTAFRPKCGRSGAVSSSIYGLGFIGAVIYYLQHASGFWDGVLGIFKALVWPAVLIYKLMEFLGM